MDQLAVRLERIGHMGFIAQASEAIRIAGRLNCKVVFRYGNIDLIVGTSDCVSDIQSQLERKAGGKA